MVTDPEASLKKATELLGDNNYEEARQLLNEIKSVDTTRTYAPLAQLKLAESYAKEDDDDLAISEYRKFLEQYPDSQYAPYAQFQIATLYFSEVKGPERGAGAAKQALEEYLKLRERYPRNPYKEIVEENIKKCKNIMAEYEFLVGKFYYKKESYKAALGRFLRVLHTYPEYKSLDEVFFYTALSYKEQGSKDEASKYLTQLKERFPDSSYTKNLTRELSAE
jgi:outer membrane protein assembly factor BamD